MSFIDSLTGPVLISAMTVAELYAGVREGNERQALDAFIRAFLVIPSVPTSPSRAAFIAEIISGVTVSDLRML